MSPADNSSRLLADKLPRTCCCALSPLSRLVGRVSVDATFVRGSERRLSSTKERGISPGHFLNTFVHSKFFFVINSLVAAFTTRQLEREICSFVHVFSYFDETANYLIFSLILFSLILSYSFRDK